MARWDDGYVTDVVYTSNFYREMTPAWLATAALLLGHRPPDLSRPFRYADLGCGNGFTAIAVAATSPQAEVWGFDFNPAHIETARDLAARAGLTNVHFVETSFAELAALPAAALPEFDFITSHGVLSWISVENQRHMIDVFAQRLRPGGLGYVSYNVTTGWAAMVPLRALMRMLAASRPERTDLGVPAILEFVDRMRTAGGGFFQAYPGLEQRLNEVRQQDPRYFAHEFLNQDWRPVMFADVSKAMTDAKCTFIGSATLTENIDGISVPQTFAPLLAEARDPLLRETLRDFGAGQGFRRDIYRRGISPIPPPEQQALLDELTLIWTGQTAGEQVTVNTPIGPVTGRPEIYRPLLARLEAGPLSLREARTADGFAGRSLVELLHVVTLLIAGSFAHPALPGGMSAATRDSTARLNAALAALNANGGDMPRLAAPGIGSAMNVDMLESLAVGEILAGIPAELDPLTDRVIALLAQGNRSLQRDGQVVTDPVQAREIVAGALRNILERRLPVLRSQGVVD